MSRGISSNALIIACRAAFNPLLDRADLGFEYILHPLKLVNILVIGIMSCTLFEEAGHYRREAAHLQRHQPSLIPKRIRHAHQVNDPFFEFHLETECD